MCLCLSSASQGHGGKRRLHGHCAVHQPAVAVGQGALTGAELPAEAQHEDDTTTTAGESPRPQSETFGASLCGNTKKAKEAELFNPTE